METCLNRYHRPTPNPAPGRDAVRRDLLTRLTGLAGIASLGTLPLALAGCGGTPAVGRDTAAAAPAADALAAYPALPAGPESGADPAVHQQVRALGRGINFGNIFDSPREGDWGLRADDQFIDLVGRDGFTHSVRLPVRWSNHASVDASARIDPAFFSRVESVVDRLLARGASVLLNVHHYRQFDGDPLDPGETAVDPAVVDVRFLALWQQIAERFASYGPALMFEIYNEPHGRLEPLWNDMLSRALRIIRVHNPQRVVVIGPTEWNSANALPRLVLPADRHVALTVHHYEPFAFTHQGAEWVKPALPTGVGCCDEPQQALMLRLLDLAAAEGRRRNYPVLVGEFGAYSQAPLPARLRYLRFMRDAMEARDMPWMAWELASGFGIYDPQARRMRPELYDALFGP
jgi:endoglucanase